MGNSPNISVYYTCIGPVPGCPEMTAPTVADAKASTGTDMSDSNPY